MAYGLKCHKKVSSLHFFSLLFPFYLVLLTVNCLAYIMIEAQCLHILYHVCTHAYCPPPTTHIPPPLPQHTHTHTKKNQQNTWACKGVSAIRGTGNWQFTFSKYIIQFFCLTRTFSSQGISSLYLKVIIHKIFATVVKLYLVLL